MGRAGIVDVNGHHRSHHHHHRGWHPQPGGLLVWRRRAGAGTTTAQRGGFGNVHSVDRVQVGWQESARCGCVALYRLILIGRIPLGA